MPFPAPAPVAVPAPAPASMWDALKPKKSGFVRGLQINKPPATPKKKRPAGLHYHAPPRRLF